MKFGDIETFVSEYSANLSMGGIFIKTRNPRKIGTVVELRMNLQNGKELVDAVGRVVRVIHPGDEYTGATPGMAVEFTDLNKDSKRIIEKCLMDKDDNE